MNRRNQLIVLLAIAVLATIGIVDAVTDGDGEARNDGELAGPTGTSTPSTSSAPSSTQPLSSSTTDPDSTSTTDTTAPTGGSGCEAGLGEGDNNDGVGLCSLGEPFDDPDFFPIAVFNADEEEAEIFAEQGFNLVLTGANPPDRQPSWGGPKEPVQMEPWADAGIHVLAAYDMAGPLQPAADNPYLIGFGSTDEPVRQFGLTADEVGSQFDKVAAIEGFEDHLGFVTFAGHSLFYEPRGTRPEVVEETKKISADDRNDFLAFDIYPISYCSPEGFFRIFEECDIGVVGHAVDHFQGYSAGTKPVLSWTDARHVYGEQWPGEDKVPFIDALVWIPIIHGSKGVAWFTTEPGFKPAGYLQNAEVSGKVKEINEFVTSLAPVLNSPGRDTATATSSDDAVTMDLGGRVHDGRTYIFAVADAHSLGDGPTVDAEFTVAGVANGSITELRSGDTLDVVDNVFTDTFDPYEVKIYEITPS